MFIKFVEKNIMARTRKERLIQMAPHFSGFKPVGVQCKKAAEVFIQFEEYEAINLCDYELLTQAEAAKLMKISRPTFTRIYESARRKVAKAFVEGGCIHFEEGNTIVEHAWFRCNKCKITFSLPDESNHVCPFCKSKEITENI
jgi:predicted DNA-binding protein (UPF0251 family)